MTICADEFRRNERDLPNRPEAIQIGLEAKIEPGVKAMIHITRPPIDPAVRRQRLKTTICGIVGRRGPITPRAVQQGIRGEMRCGEIQELLRELAEESLITIETSKDGKRVRSCLQRQPVDLAVRRPRLKRKICGIVNRRGPVTPRAIQQDIRGEMRCGEIQELLRELAEENLIRIETSSDGRKVKLCLQMPPVDLAIRSERLKRIVSGIVNSVLSRLVV
jgi:hypothetical protein